MKAQSQKAKQALTNFAPDHAEEISQMSDGLAMALHAQILGLIDIGDKAVKLASQ